MLSSAKTTKCETNASEKSEGQNSMNQNRVLPLACSFPGSRRFLGRVRVVGRRCAISSAPPVPPRGGQRGCHAIWMEFSCASQAIERFQCLFWHKHSARIPVLFLLLRNNNNYNIIIIQSEFGIASFCKEMNRNSKELVKFLLDETEFQWGWVVRFLKEERV